jgi:hypothetical protein
VSPLPPTVDLASGTIPSDSAASDPAARPRLRWTAACELLGLGLLALGCSVAPANDETDSAKGSTQAVIAVSREDALDAAPRGDALAGFVQLPATADRDSALELAGLGVEVPDVGQCWRKSPDRPQSSLSGVSHIEFLDAGRVRLVAGSAEPHELAPHAFPTIADFISGVVYASRDQSGEGLPPGQIYRIETSSGGIVGALSASHEAPALPKDITLSGSDFATLASLKGGQPLDLTWGVSNDPTDRLYAELSGGRGAGVVCAFDDANGAGTIPTDGFVAGDQVHLAVHRLRLVRTTPTSAGAASEQDRAVDQLELRFDFSVSRSIRFE